MKVGDKYKNYNELNGLFTYEVLEIKDGDVFMTLHYPEEWGVPSYPTRFSEESAKIYLSPIKWIRLYTWL